MLLNVLLSCRQQGESAAELAYGVPRQQGASWREALACRRLL